MRVGDLETIFRALNEAKAKYLVVGGMAVIAHGYGRATVAEPFPFTEEYAAAFWDDVGAVRVPFVRYERLLQLKRESGRLQDVADIEALEMIKANWRK